MIYATSGRSVKVIEWETLRGLFHDHTTIPIPIPYPPIWCRIYRRQPCC